MQAEGNSLREKICPFLPRLQKSLFAEGLGLQHQLFEKWWMKKDYVNVVTLKKENTN